MAFWNDLGMSWAAKTGQFNDCHTQKALNLMVQTPS
jgi:nitrogen fixation-related uncharacterized protein